MKHNPRRRQTLHLAGQEKPPVSGRQSVAGQEVGRPSGEPSGRAPSDRTEVLDASSALRQSLVCLAGRQPSPHLFIAVHHSQDSRTHTHTQTRTDKKKTHTVTYNRAHPLILSSIRLKQAATRRRRTTATKQIMLIGISEPLCVKISSVASRVKGALRLRRRRRVQKESTCLCVFKRCNAEETKLDIVKKIFIGGSELCIKMCHRFGAGAGG